jgi:hypothetical protein
MKVEAFFFIFCLANIFMLRMLWVLVKSNEARLERLERAKQVPVVKAPSPQVAQQTRQVFEKPIVPGAKPVTSLEIGAGRLSFDDENQVAEWI